VALPSPPACGKKLLPFASQPQLRSLPSAAVAAAAAALAFTSALPTCPTAAACITTLATGGPASAAPASAPAAATPPSAASPHTAIPSAAALAALDAAVASPPVALDAAVASPPVALAAAAGGRVSETEDQPVYDSGSAYWRDGHRGSVWTWSDSVLARSALLAATERFNGGDGGGGEGGGQAGGGGGGSGEGDDDGRPDDGHTCQEHGVACEPFAARLSHVAPAQPALQ
jgi:hypothetical protein